MVEPKEPLPPFPRSDDQELGYQVANTALSAASAVVPGAGYALQQIVKRFIGSPLEARRSKWFQRVGEGLKELEEKMESFDLNRLAEDEDFISIVYQTTDAAMRAHREEKREALCNVLLNSAIGYQLDEVLRSTFINYVDRFSPLHLRLLKLLADPSASAAMVAQAKNMMMGSQSVVVRAALPESEVSEELFDRITSDLAKEGLIDGSLKAMITAQSLLAKRSTKIGDEFLRFISKPLTVSTNDNAGA